MTVKQQLIAEIQNIDNSIALVQLFEVMQFIKNNNALPQSQNVLTQFSGCLNDKDAKEMRNIIDNEFKKIEGEW